MIYLVDTHVLIWLAVDSPRLSDVVRDLLSDPDNHIFFSAISIFEIAVKERLSKRGFDVEANVIRRMMIENDFAELSVTGLHAAHVATLPLWGPACKLAFAGHGSPPGESIDLLAKISPAGQGQRDG